MKITDVKWSEYLSKIILIIQTDNVMPLLMKSSSLVLTFLLLILFWDNVMFLKSPRSNVSSISRDF